MNRGIAIYLGGFVDGLRIAGFIVVIVVTLPIALLTAAVAGWMARGGGEPFSARTQNLGRTPAAAGSGAGIEPARECVRADPFSEQ